MEQEVGGATSTTMAPEKSLINVLNICDNFRPHLSPEHLVPFLLSQDTRPALGLLRPPVVAALRADNAWLIANGHPLTWDIPDPAPADTHAPHNESDSPSPPPYIAFAPPLARGTPAARSLALAETLERWRAVANGVGDMSEPANAFDGVIGGSRWRAEWYDVYASPGGALRTDGRDPRTVLEGTSGYVFSMERSACALFGVVTYGVHMTVYERDEEGAGEGGVRVWVPRRALTKPTCVHLRLFASRVLQPHAHIRVLCGRRPANVQLPRHARQLGRRRHSWGHNRVRLDRQRGCGGGEPGHRTRAQACAHRRRRVILLSD